MRLPSAQAPDMGGGEGDRIFAAQACLKSWRAECTAQGHSASQWQMQESNPEFQLHALLCRPQQAATELLSLGLINVFSNSVI